MDSICAVCQCEFTLGFWEWWVNLGVPICDDCDKELESSERDDIEQESE